MTHETPSPSALLQAALDDRKIGPTEFGKMVGVGYQTVYRWLRGDYFPPRQQRRAAEALCLPPDYFDRPDEVAQRAAEQARAFERFLRGPYGHGINERERRFLSCLNPTDPEFVADEHWFAVQLGLFRSVITAAQARASLRAHTEIKAAPRPRRPGRPRKRRD